MVRLCNKVVLLSLTVMFVACLQTEYATNAAPAWNYIPKNDAYFAQANEEQKTPNKTNDKPNIKPRINPNALKTPIKQDFPKGVGEVVQIYYVNGELAWEIHLLNGKQHGTTKHFYSNGQLRGELNFTNGKANGELIQYYHYGVIKSEERYENDLLVGTSKFYTPLGELKRTVRYENGKQVEELNLLASK